MLWPLCLQIPHPATSPYFGDRISSCRTLGKVHVLPRLPTAPLSAPGRLRALQPLLVRWQTGVSFFCTPTNLNLLSCSRINQPCSRSVHRQHLQQICTSTKETGEKQKVKDIVTEGCRATSKGVSKSQNVVSDNTKHFSSCKSDVQLPLLVVCLLVGFLFCFFLRKCAVN